LNSKLPKRHLFTIWTLARHPSSNQDAGRSIAMDDFGTGYSSLSNLLAFPFDKIKIDGSFIKSVSVNEKAAEVVRSVLGLGRAASGPGRGCRERGPTSVSSK
jgi:EAL domain-containing protein (putative c-di-GMP-specific phosphodiesterase class I)